MFSRKLKPIFVDNKYLVRLGPQRDGGYIIDKRIINIDITDEILNKFIFLEKKIN